MPAWIAKLPGRGLILLPGVTTMADKVLLKLLEVRQVGVDLRMTLEPST